MVANLTKAEALAKRAALLREVRKIEEAHADDPRFVRKVRVAGREYACFSSGNAREIQNVKGGE